MPRSRWDRLQAELHGEQARTQQEKHCASYGHTWKPLAKCNPGDSDWCRCCGYHRTVAADGTVTIERPE